MRLVSLVTLLSLSAATLASGNTATTVPITLRQHGALITIQIQDLRILVQVDLGDATSLALQQDVLDRLHAVPKESEAKILDAKGNVIHSPEYVIPKLRIGAETFTDVTVRVDAHAPSYQAMNRGQRGFLGTGLMKSDVVRLDYRHRTMTLIHDPGTDAPIRGCTGESVPFLPEGKGEPLTAVETDLGRAALWWDTGAPATSISRAYADRAHAGGDRESIHSARFSLGGHDFGPQRIDIWDVLLPSEFQGFIGHDFFAKHVVCVDFPRRRLLVGH